MHFIHQAGLEIALSYMYHMQLYFLGCAIRSIAWCSSNQHVQRCQQQLAHLACFNPCAPNYFWMVVSYCNSLTIAVVFSSREAGIVDV